MKKEIKDYKRSFYLYDLKPKTCDGFDSSNYTFEDEIDINTIGSFEQNKIHLKEKQKLISFLKNKIKKYESGDYERLTQKQIQIRTAVRLAYQEVLEFVINGG